MSDSIEQKVKAIIADQLNLKAEELNLDASFIDDLGADSLEIVELVMAFEEAFEMEIKDEEAEKIQTVRDAVNYIRAHADA